MVDKTISDLYCDESTFNNTKVNCELVLKHSGYKSEIIDIRTVAPWLVNDERNALHTKRKLLPLTNVNSTMEE